MKFIEFDDRLINVDHISMVGKVRESYEGIYYFHILINGTYIYDVEGSKEEVEKKREELIKLISHFHSIAAPLTNG